MTFDVILLAYSKTEKHKQTTVDCIKSLKKAKNKHVEINIIVLESYDIGIKFKDSTTFFYQQHPFNYNESQNKGFALSTADYVFFCNNDLEFFDFWADECYKVFRMGYKSLSPYCPVSHPRWFRDGNFIQVGYQVGVNLPGWCIGVERKMFEELGGFNTAVTFWFSDNIYAEQLKISGVKHALVCSSFVKHLDFGSKTLNSLTNKERVWLTTKQRKRYIEEVKRMYDAEEKKVLRKSP